MTSEWQYKLFSSSQVDPSLLLASAHYLTQKDYQEVVQERNSDKLCGYPPCHLPCSRGKYKISRSKSQIYSMNELLYYCSYECMRASLYFKSQLAEDSLSIGRSGLDVELYSESLTDHESPVSNKDSCSTPTQLISEYSKSLSIHFEKLEIQENIQESARADTIISMDMNYDPLCIEGYATKASHNEKNILFKKALSEQTMVMMDVMEETPTPYTHTPMSTGNSTPTLENEDEDYESFDVDSDEEEALDSSDSKQQGLQDRHEKQQEQQQEQESQEEEEDSDLSWFKPNKKKPKIALSHFGKIWTALDRLISTETKQFVTTGVFPYPSTFDLKSSDSNYLTRIQLFSKKISSAFNLIKRKHGLQLILHDDLNKIIKTCHFTEQAVYSLDEDWILCIVFLKVLSLHSNIISNAMEDKWEVLMKKMNMGMDELNVFVKAFTLT